jgi:O-antigen/teichoic acid export membrane protein
MFITNMVMSVLMFVILFFCAPLIANFFEREELTLLTRVMGLILIIQALSIVQNTYLTKKIDFKTKTKSSLIAAVISGIAGISTALLNFGVWALVIQQLTNQIVNTFCLWILNRYIPHLKFSKENFGYMWGFGWKLMLSGFLDRLWAQLYQTVVGKCYSPETLGQYTRSKQYAQIFSQNFTSIIQRVTYPVLAETQDDKPRMVAAYRKIIKISMFVTAICMISLGAIRIQTNPRNTSLWEGMDLDGPLPDSSLNSVQDRSLIVGCSHSLIPAASPASPDPCCSTPVLSRRTTLLPACSQVHVRTSPTPVLPRTQSPHQL